MIDLSTLLAILCSSLLALVVVQKWLSKSKPNTNPLPPGPEGLPLIGNIKDLPPPGKPEYQHWLSFKDRYGVLSSVTILGQTMIIIHDKDIAFELMEKRANRSSGRPELKFVTMYVLFCSALAKQLLGRICA